MSISGLLRAVPGEGPFTLWRRARRRRDEVVLVPLARGAGAFISSSRLVSVLAAPGSRSALPLRLLERVQARRSRLLVATEREVAIACVRRWNLHLSRIRLLPDLDRALEARLAIELDRQLRGRAAWHSTR